mmetsp:Transcript_51581/g.95454  ORF Transcript_51581/g.95454 Transcript_51581/m.95454 type:complete len:340 (-) Transcript_51581:41-1060(-)
MSWGGPGGPWGGSWGGGKGSSGGGGGAGNDANPPCDNLFVAGLPGNATLEDVQQLFGQYGTVVQAKVLDPNRTTGKVAALVRFPTTNEAVAVKTAVAQQANIPNGLTEPVQITFAFQKTGGAGAGWNGSSPAPPSGGPWGMGKGGPPSYGGPMGGKSGPPAWGSGPSSSWGGGPPSWGSGFDKGLEKGSMIGAAPGGAAGGKGWGKSTGASDIEQVVHGFEVSGGMPGGTAFAPEECQVYVSSLPPDCSEIHLFKIFASFGPIMPRGVKIMRHPDGSCKGFGFVNFIHAEAAQAATATVNGTVMPNGNSLTVKLKSGGKHNANAGLSAMADISGGFKFG